jgi:Na+/H+ antiporter NhaD/arsenite permease-like protein
MAIFLILTFIVGYACIAFEHPLKLDKAASAILTGVLCWTILVFGQESLLGTKPDEHFIYEEILHHLGEIAQILFFLLGAMTIVELIDVHGGFQVITSRIKTTGRVKLFWIIGIITFFLSSVLDNLTTTIVMAALLKKLIDDKEDLWLFAGVVVIAANAGGAWSPIGDVTTIMLWIGGQITAVNIIKGVFIPSVLCLITPLIVLSFIKKGEIRRPIRNLQDSTHHPTVSQREANIMLWLGVGGLLFVPVFKNITHLPPFMGILLSLGLLWVATTFMHSKKEEDQRQELSVTSVIRRVDTPSVLFFLGILLAVAGLQSAGQLNLLASQLDASFDSIYVVNVLIGLLSAIIDNVPLVAGAMGMYPLSVYPQNHQFWELLAYCAGTGGSALIIGSAAGVAMMGILKIDFIWYLKKVSWLALLGYFSGVLFLYLIK